MGNLIRKEDTKRLLDKAIDILDIRPLKIVDFLNEIGKQITGINDSLFWNGFQEYILSLLEYNSCGGNYKEENLRKFKEALAEATPNLAANYYGNQERLREYYIRIIKIINECSTETKAVYLANLSRAFSDRMFGVNDYFKLSRCIQYLTEEDLLFLKNKITEEVVNEEGDYYEDFQSQGLMSLRAGGYIYTMRAFMLRNYSLAYEEDEIWPTKAISGRPVDYRMGWGKF